MSPRSEFGDTEWNFSEHVLPDSEVRACLIWECGRECREFYKAEMVAELRAKMQRSYWDQAQQVHVENAPQDRWEARKATRQIGFDLDTYWERLYACHLAYNSFYSQVELYARPWALPWREIDEVARHSAVKELDAHGIFPPLRLSNLRELEALWLGNGEEIIAIKEGRVTPAYDDTLEMLGFEESHSIEIPHEKREPVVREIHTALSVNFSLFTDGEIVEAFKKWLSEVRPCLPPQRKGKKLNDDRAALEGIGMMRALHQFPFSNANFPAPLKRRGQRACYKGRKLALKRYLEIFPFLEANSTPESWETKGSKTASKFP
jgi:hypothetical protein